ncbi:putative MFS multidrug transporter [Choiromyces venosus 120613-1]|uniref:Putative MFS multidrug transporter n=1 Tax=Choiromyces venosus 120613-1 TaxID=1336337 RepID=A0A3N4JN88_9PEZI|nr:putative MFS multidrug transporter [Choiromyces venosus 120613-1]
MHPELNPLSREESRQSGRATSRIYSHHLDDQSIYHSQTEFEKPEDDNSDVASKDLEAADDRPQTPPLGREKTHDPNVVTFGGPEDMENPKNWSFRTKWGATAIVSAFTFISPVSSTMVAPALGKMAEEFGVTKEMEISLMLSIFVLAYAFGPLVLGPLSEVYGRVPIIQFANLFYLVWNIACGFSQTKAQMIAFRFLSGLGGSAPLAIGGGVLSDVWAAEQRGKAISLYSLAPLLGPAAGPIAGGFIVGNTTWRWIFHATSIVDFLVQILGLFFLRETYPPKILANKTARLIQETGNQNLRSEYDDSDKTIGKILRISLVRPFKLLGTQVIVQVLALYMAYLYGLMYLVLSTFPTLWGKEYHMSIGIGGLNYLSMGLGFFLGAQICAPLNDKIYIRLKARNSGKGKPEFRVPLMFVGAILVPVGLFWYGWSAQHRLHWIMPNIGACIFCAGSIIGFQCIQTYIVDSYTRYAASAIGAAATLRSLAGFGFPLFAPYMYQKLDYGWGNSVLGFLALVLGVPAPFLLWQYGSKLRARSTFAAGAAPK